MLLSKSVNSTYLWQTRNEDDKIVFTHIQNVDEVAESALEIRTHSDNGFTKNREMQHIARIPELEAAKHPEIFQDEHAMKMYLQGEGRRYCTCNPAGI
jgi:hypothetical protein